MKNIRYGVVINPNGIQLSTNDTIHFGHTLDIIGHLPDGSHPNLTVQPHGLNEGPFAVLAEDIRITNP